MLGKYNVGTKNEEVTVEIFCSGRTRRCDTSNCVVDASRGSGERGRMISFYSDQPRSREAEDRSRNRGAGDRSRNRGPEELSRSRGAEDQSRNRGAEDRCFLIQLYHYSAVKIDLQ